MSIREQWEKDWDNAEIASVQTELEAELKGELMYNIPEEHIELASNILTTLMYWRGQNCEIPDELFIYMKDIGRSWIEIVLAVEEINNKEVN